MADLPAKFTLTVEAIELGYFRVTSDAHRGFLLVGADLSGSLTLAPKVLLELLDIQGRVDRGESV